MADMVASAVVQEFVCRAISFVFGNRDEQAPHHLHSAERLEMAVSELEFVLERTAKLPITDLSLLRRRKMFKLAYVEGTDLLTKHRQEGRGVEVMKQVVKRSRIWIARASVSSSSASSSMGDDVRRFDWLAEHAGKFLRDVESGCLGRQHTFCRPVTRHLLEGKTLRYEMKLGSRSRRFYMWPVCVEGRGVETTLEYWYEDHEMPEKCFHPGLMLRVSESTDVVANAAKCLQSLASQFKLATETATGELALMANSHYTSRSHDAPPPWADEADEQSHTKYSQSLRPDPICCKDRDNNNVSSSELSHAIPEQVILFSFGCHTSSISEQECSFHGSSSSEQVANASARRDGQRSPLELTALFAPHLALKEDQPQEGYALEKLGDSVARRYVSVQQMAETIRSKATDCFLHHPEVTGYAVSWIAKHGLAAFDVRKTRTEIGPKTSGRSRSRRNAKRRR